MDKAKAAVSDFMHKAGHRDTTVHETVAPAVQHETIKPHKHEEVSTVIDKEIHQDHYHQTVQPVKDREVHPEKHVANIGAVKHKEFDHRDHEANRRSLAAKQEAFRDEQVVAGTTHTQSAAPSLAGEHVQHHIHETIQPVVNKETIQPTVVHTTVPIHEVHHNQATHHNTSELPPVSMSEYKQRGGVLGGREERYDGFEGEPKNISGLMSSMKDGHKRDSHHTDSHIHKSALHGDYNPIDGKDIDRRDVGTASTTGHLGSKIPVGTASHRSPAENAMSAATTDASHHHHTSADNDFRNASSGHKEPSLMDKLNPKIDADGDGKKGFMS